VTTPDPTDLRLASALAELGRTTVFEIAARAGVHVEEAAVRLLRMGGSGLPLVVGVEGDRAALHRWLGGQQAPAPAVWTAPPSPPRQPLGWGVPQSAAWTRAPEPTAPPAAPASPSAATIGDTCSAVNSAGEALAISLVEVVDTADALIAAAGHQLTPGTRATVVHTEVTAGPGGYRAIPDTCLTLVLGDGSEVRKSGITLSSRPPFRSGVAARDTVGGHTVFELDSQAAIAGVRWRPAGGAAALDWHVR